MREPITEHGYLRDQNSTARKTSVSKQTRAPRASPPPPSPLLPHHSPPPPPPEHEGQTVEHPCRYLRFVLSLAADIMCDVGRAGAAMRRRQRHLRAFLRLEGLCVKMALVKAFHHSAQRVEGPGRGARYVRSSTETEGTSPWNAAGASV